MGVAGVLGVFACTEDIDDSNLYMQAEGVYASVEAFLSDSEKNPELSEFNAIVEKAGLTEMLSSYGTYTCFAPTNDAVNDYIDSLYTDVTSPNHNGLTDNSLEGLLNSEKADSLCQEIAKFHVAGIKVQSIEMGDDKAIRMMSGRSVQTRLDSVSGEMTVNTFSQISSADNETENGLVHIVDCVLRKSDNNVMGEMDKVGGYTLWCKAMDLCGLSGQLDSTSRTTGIEWFTEEGPETKYPKAEFPTECQVGFTIFAESDAVLEKNNITSLDQLIAYANEQYKNCAQWYDYVADNNIQVSTGSDYENEWNALNMFLRYHIVAYKVPTDKLVYSYNESNDFLYEYYRTLLPHTMFKVTKRKSVGDRYFINCSESYASLCQTPGSTEYVDGGFHKFTLGIEIDKDNSKSALNGYIHPINSMLVYNTDVPNKVLNERIRMDFMAMLDELMSNGFRGISWEELTAYFNRTEKKGAAIRFPAGYFKNMVVYSPETTKAYYLTKDECHSQGQYSYDCWNNWQGDELYCLGAYDFAIKLPPAPKDGTYEIRFGYVNNGARTIVQMYLGTSSEKSSMVACDIPIDQNLSFSSLGWTSSLNESDLGAETDKNLRNRGYMRGPYYFSNHTNGTAAQMARNWNSGGQGHIRRIVTRQNLKQGEYWLRFKTCLPENTTAQFQLDYVELVPVNVYNNPEGYTEDVF